MLSANNYLNYIKIRKIFTLDDKVVILKTIYLFNK